MAPTPLDTAKSRVSRALLGRDGVHGVGLRRAQKTIVLYVDGLDAAAQKALAAKAKEVADPFVVEIVDSPPARAG